MSTLASCLYSAALIGLVCQSHSSSLSSLRRDRSSDVTSNGESLHRLTEGFARGIKQLDILGKFDYRPRRDVPASSYNKASPRYTTTTNPPRIVHGYAGKKTNVDDYTGVFDFSFETEEGIKVQAKGSPKILDTGEVVQAMEGQYSYTAPDDTLITTKWFADETGFHAVGAHIPGSTS